jgi:hypothetical protein
VTSKGSGIPAKGAGHGGPARGYSWEPFQPGNTVSLRHGARSPRVYGPIAAALVEAVLAERGDLAAYIDAVQAWADAEARAALLREHLEKVGMLDDGGQPHESLLKWLVAFEKRAEAGRSKLGLDPRSHAELLKSRVEAQRSAVDLDGLRARGAEIIEAREQHA